MSEYSKVVVNNTGDLIQLAPGVHQLFQSGNIGAGQAWVLEACSLIMYPAKGDNPQQLIFHIFVTDYYGGEASPVWVYGKHWPADPYWPYNEDPPPAVDNHMIATYNHDERPYWQVRQLLNHPMRIVGGGLTSLRIVAINLNPNPASFYYSALFTKTIP